MANRIYNRVKYYFIEPLALFHRQAYWSSLLKLPDRDIKTYIPGITPILRIKNEDTWIETIVRTLSKVFNEIIIIDNKSEDKTLDILTQLVKDGFPLKIYSYHDPSGNENIVKNLILDRLIKTDWYSFWDGDELQFEESCRAVQSECLLPILQNTYSKYMFFRHNHPKSIFLITPHQFDGRFQMKKIFNSHVVRFLSSGWSDTPLVDRKNRIINIELLNNGNSVVNSYVLHMTFCQRSTIKSWDGLRPAVREARIKWRNSRYVAHEEEYEVLSTFPKEFLECKYSSHNPYRDSILNDKKISFV